jgi:hypothetical protein
MSENQPTPTPSQEPRLPDPIIPPQPSTRYVERLGEILSDAPDESEIQRLYLGRAGELFVTAHLLRRGLNCAPLPVDTGVDLLAHRELKLDVLLHQAEHELYQFQVKTTATNEYRASLPVRKVHDLWHKAINLVVVFWSEETAPSAVVLPPSLIRFLTSGGFEDPRAPLVTTGDEVSLRVIESGGRYFIRNLDNDITAMRNRFDRLEPIGIDTGTPPDYVLRSDDKGWVAFDPD